MNHMELFLQSSINPDKFFSIEWMKKLKKQLEARKNGYGFFVLSSGLSVEELIDIYKSRNIVEQGFKALKSDYSKMDYKEAYALKVENLFS